MRTGRTAMARTDEGTEWREPFARFDLRAAYSLPGGFELAAGVDNVFDTRVNDWPGFTGLHLYTTITWRAVHDR